MSDLTLTTPTEETPAVPARMRAGVRLSALLAERSDDAATVRIREAYIDGDGNLIAESPRAIVLAWADVPLAVRQALQSAQQAWMEYRRANEVTSADGAVHPALGDGTVA